MSDARPCPRCEGLQLVLTQTDDGIELDSCTRCHGVWYDRGELAAKYDMPRSGITNASSIAVSDRKLLCPVCSPYAMTERFADRDDPTILVYECHQCGGSWLDKEVWVTLSRRKRVAEIEASRTQKTAHRPQLKADAGNRIPFDNLWLNVGLPPAAFMIAALLVLLGGHQLFVFAEIMIHEIGHAIPAWFSGRAALPLPFGITFWKEDPSIFVTLCLTFLIGVFAFRSFKEEKYVSVGIAGALFVFQMLFTFAVSEYRSKMAIVWGGTAGEFIVSTFILLVFHYPVADKLRWDFWRLLLYLPAAVTFVGSLKQWILISEKKAQMPMQSLYSRKGDGFSDLERLLNEFGWSADQITDIYVALGLLCALTLFVHYGFVVMRNLFFADDD